MKYKYLVIFVTFILSNLSINAQEKAEKESLSSKLYFPFDIGYLVSLKNELKPGIISKVAIEYRMHSTEGVYFRLNYDNRTNSYRNQKVQETNIIKGKVKFTDYIVGLGYRFSGKSKFRQFTLLQTGLSSFGYQNVETSDINYIVNDRTKNVAILKLTAGAEYYIGKSAALTFETGYIWQLGNTPFVKNHINEGTLSFSIGLTTTLF